MSQCATRDGRMHNQLLDGYAAPVATHSDSHNPELTVEVAASIAAIPGEP